MVIATLVGAGAALQPLAESVRETAGPAAPTEGPGRREALLGQGMSVAVLGGYRALTADLLWLETYLAWAAGDLPATQSLIRLVTTVDERPVWFWLNGARMIAYDLAHWRLARASRAGPLTAEARRRINAEQADAALRLLADARGHHPESAAIAIEMANIELYVRGDVPAAARRYRQAAESPRAPYCAARIYAELLKRQGRHADAYAWLRHLHPTLPSDDPEAMSAIVLDRIRELERILEVPEGKRYAPRAACMQSGVEGRVPRATETVNRAKSR